MDKYSHRRLSCLAALAAIGLSGCGDDDTATTGETTSTTGTTATTTTTTTTTTAGTTSVETTTTAGETDASTGTPEDAVCGDGLVSTGEECDNGPDNGSDGLCSADCKEVQAACGDGLVSGDEECDDGANNGPDKACTAACKNNVCGDGFPGPGEECDQGRANVDGGACSTMCKTPVCGDGVINAGEECDQGAANGDDQTCTSACKNAFCGDGLVGPGEGCDDGNQVPDDACTNECALGSCGDGVKQAPEECDDGNADNTDSCINTCVAASCGDGQVWAGSSEECDDGNADNTDGCTTLCTPPSCEDGLLSGDEEDVDCGGATCKSCFGLYQHRWKGAETVQSGQWKKINAADAPIVTRGGPLEIELSIPLVGGGDSACRPTIDGNWAGKAQGLPEVATWHEGRERTDGLSGKAPRMWRRVRVYYNIAAGSHTLGVQCRTSSGSLMVGRAESTATLITREYDGNKNLIHQKITLSGTTMGVSAEMVKAANSDLTFDTVGGDIEVALSLPIGNGGHAGCLPWMDGAPIPSEEQAYVNGFWSAGLASTYGSWLMWTHSRLYKNISAGTHTFSIRCYNDSGTLNIGDADVASVILVRELDNSADNVGQGVDKSQVGAWKIDSGTDSLWYDLSDHQTVVSVTHGSLEVTEFLGYYHINADSWFTCRPVINGKWIGTLGGDLFTSNEEEGVVHQQASNGHHGTWHRRRIYDGIPLGDHVVSLQCLSNGNEYWASQYGQGTLTVRDVGSVLALGAPEQRERGPLAGRRGDPREVLAVIRDVDALHGRRR